jgi:hypothetical protein
MRVRKHPLTPLAAVAAGLLAGAVGTVGLDAVHYLKHRRAGGTQSPLTWEFAPVDSWETAPDPGQAARRVIEGFTERKLSDRWAWPVSTAAHWAYGSAAAATYGITAGSVRGPGSSIMPGKVNPTQAEAMLMVAIQVIASDLAVTMGGAEGNFELNAFRPILIANYLHSALIMADMCDHFRQFMVEGTTLNRAKLTDNIDRSVMMVTALSPVIGYDQAAAISYYAIDHDLTLKQAALAKGVSEELFDRVVDPLALTRSGTPDLPQAARSTTVAGGSPAHR